MKKIQTIIDNYFNGNLTDAQNEAKKVSLKSIISYLEDSLGYDYNKALLTACYLKNQISFSDLCNNLNNKK
jgi:hypothetical protein